MDKEYFCKDCIHRMNDRDGKCTKHHINTDPNGCICEDFKMNDDSDENEDMLFDWDEEEICIPAMLRKSKSVVIMSVDEHKKLLNEIERLKQENEHAKELLSKCKGVLAECRNHFDKVDEYIK